MARERLELFDVEAAGPWEGAEGEDGRGTNRLVFIGRRLNRAALTAQFCACLSDAQAVEAERFM